MRKTIKTDHGAIIRPVGNHKRIYENEKGMYFIYNGKRVYTYEIIRILNPGDVCGYKKDGVYHMILGGYVISNTYGFLVEIGEDWNGYFVQFYELVDCDVEM